MMPEPAEIRVRCYRCKTDMGEEDRLCPVCGRLQFRVCHCVKQLRMRVETCPDCGADWSRSIRHKARRKRRERGDPRELARYIAAGAVGFLLLAGSLYYVGGRVAERMLNDAAPDNPFERLWFLWRALVLSLQQIIGHVAGVMHNPHTMAAVGMAAIGGAAGLLAYLWRYRARWLEKDKHGRRRRTESSGGDK